MLNDSLTICDIDFCNLRVFHSLHGFSYYGIISSSGILEATQDSRFNVCVLTKGALRGPCSRISTVSRIGEGEPRVLAVARTS